MQLEIFQEPRISSIPQNVASSNGSLILNEKIWKTADDCHTLPGLKLWLYRETHLKVNKRESQFSGKYLEGTEIHT